MEKIICNLKSFLYKKRKDQDVLAGKKNKVHELNKRTQL